MVARASDTLPAVPDRPILELLLGDVVRLRRTHPCGGDTWLVDRLGADIGLRCQTCDRHVMIGARRSNVDSPGSSNAATRRSRRRSRPTGQRTQGPAATRACDGDRGALGVRRHRVGRRRAFGRGALAVFRNPPFLRLWLSQAATQIGGNMVLFGLTVIISENNPNTAVSLLILSFLVPAVLFSAVAEVYVDRVDRRLVLVATNVLRGIASIGLILVGDHLLLLILLNLFISTVTVFFAPAEAAMIPEVVPRRQLLSANGVFTLTLNAAFALGFALLGPLVINIAGPQAVILVVAGLYFLASIFCWTLPPSPPPARTNGGATAVGETSRAVHSTVDQLREGFGIIRENRSIAWSLLYLGIAASLIGVLGVLGPDFAQTALGLRPKDIAVIVLPLGGGIVMGILLLNSYGKFLPRRRVIEGGLVVLGVALALLRSPARSASSSSASTRPATCSTCRRSRRCSRSSCSSRSSPASPTRRWPSRPRPSSRRTCRRMSAGGSSGCSTCSCRFRASCRSSSSARSRT